MDQKQMQGKSSIVMGSFIWVKRHATIGQVVRINRGKVLIIVGALLFTLPIQEVELLEASAKSYISKKRPQTHYCVMASPDSKTDCILDVHGYNTEQALLALDKFVDRALLLNQHTLKIIHGKGNGILRKSIRCYLQQHPLVRKVITQSPIRCMAGMTEAEL